MKKIGFMAFMIFCGNAMAYEVPMQGPPQVMPQVKQMAKLYGLSDETINKMPGELLNTTEGTISAEKLKVYKGLTNDLCDTFKDAEVSFSLGLSASGQLAIMSNSLGQGFQVKLKC